MKNEKDLTVEQQETLTKLKNTNLQTRRPYPLKLALQDFWNRPHIYVDIYLKEWTGWAARSQLAPMVSLAKTVKHHEEGILR